MQTIINFILKYGKKYLPYLIILVLGLTTWFYFNKSKASNKEFDRMYSNLQNSNFVIKEMEAKDKSLYYEINQLSLKKQEFEVLVPKLNSEIKNLNSKLKNVSGITTVNTVYEVNIDTIFIDTLQKVKTFNYTDNYVSFKGQADYNKNTLNNVNLTVIDSIYFITETTYKRYWLFWKKPIGTKIKIKSENPYLYLKNIESYNLSF